MKSIFYTTLLCLIVTNIGVHAQQLDRVNTLIIDAAYDEAVNEADRGLGKVTEQGQRALLLNKKAEALIHLSRLSDAETALQEATTLTSIGTSIGATIQATQGFLYLTQGQNDKALDALMQARTTFTTVGKENSLDAAQALSFLGQTYINTGKYNQAEEQLLRSLAIREQATKDPELLAASYNDLGLVYSFMGDNDKALEYYEKAQALYEKVHGKEHPKIAIASTNIGVVYRNLELYGDAINDFEAALKIWEKVYPKAHPSKGFVLANLGQTYQKMNNLKAAKEYYERALTTYEESEGQKHPDVASTLNALGNLYLAEQDFPKAMNSYQQALQANVIDFSSNDIDVNPHLRNYYNANTLLYSLLLKAEGLESRYYGRSLKFKDLTLALATLETCDTLIDKLRQQITNESDKLALGAVANEVYADGVRIAYSAGQNAVQKKKYFEKAFYFAEKSKAAVLLEAISDAEAKSFAGIPKALLEDERTLKSALALCNQKLAQKPPAEEEKYLRETAFNLNRTYETFTQRLEKEFPSYYDLKYNAKAPSTTDLQKLLPPQSLVISYFIDDKNARLYIFTVDNDDFAIIDRALPTDFEKQITGLRNGLYFNEITTYVRTATSLSSLLLPSIESTTRNLIILPTGRLAIIPFEALFTSIKIEQADYATLPYLINRYAVQYDFSATLLIQKARIKTTTQALSILLCAPVQFDSRESLDDLPGTEAEVNDISKLFADHNQQRALFLKSSADEQLVKSEKLKSFNVLHFATHGIVDEKNPELSRIFLQSSGGEDGNLFTGEIYNLTLNANLVTLSACQTGLGKISKGEGVVGLSRALVYAGARNVIVSFWSVADESTAALMKDFYEELLEHPGGGYAPPLQSAKQAMIKKGKYAAPYYWAPFILIGF